MCWKKHCALTFCLFAEYWIYHLYIFSLITSMFKFHLNAWSNLVSIILFIINNMKTIHRGVFTQLSNDIYITIMHLADAFIQTYVAYSIWIVCIFWIHVFSGNLTHVISFASTMFSLTYEHVIMLGWLSLIYILSWNYIILFIFFHQRAETIDKWIRFLRIAEVLQSIM